MSAKVNSDDRATGGRRTREQGDRTRQSILEAALDLYADRGFRGTGLAAIGERAGVSHATVLYHYGSSRALLLAVLDERERRFSEETAWAWSQGGLDAIRNLPVVGRYNAEHPGLAKLFTVLEAESLDLDEGSHEHFVRRRRALHDLLVATIAQAAAAGDLRPGIDGHIKADEIIAFMDGAQMQYALDPERVALVALYESYTDALVRDIVAAGRSATTRSS